MKNVSKYMVLVCFLLFGTTAAFAARGGNDFCTNHPEHYKCTYVSPFNFVKLYWSDNITQPGQTDLSVKPNQILDSGFAHGARDPMIPQMVAKYYLPDGTLFFTQTVDKTWTYLANGSVDKEYAKVTDVCERADMCSFYSETNNLVRVRENVLGYWWCTNCARSIVLFDESSGQCGYPHGTYKQVVMFGGPTKTFNFEVI